MTIPMSSHFERGRIRFAFVVGFVVVWHLFISVVGAVAVLVVVVEVVGLVEVVAVGMTRQLATPLIRCNVSISAMNSGV